MKKNSLTGELIPAAEAAALCGIDLGTFLSWIPRRDLLPPVADRRGLLFSREMMLAWVAEKTRPGRPGRKVGSLMPQTLALIEAAKEVLEEQRPERQTLRQVFYQLVSRQAVANSINEYNRLSDALIFGRTSDMIAWELLEDRTRLPRSVSMWESVDDFIDTAIPQYRQTVWANQPGYLEAWLEKDALSGIFETLLGPYAVALNVGRGFTSWTSVKEAAARYEGRADTTTILYFGDWDPSGEGIENILQEYIAWFGLKFGWFDHAPEVVRVAVTKEDIARHNLPPNLAKESDSRRAAFVARHGDETIELDALPADELRRRIVESVEARMDMDALERVRRQDAEDRATLRRRWHHGG